MKPGETIHIGDGAYLHFDGWGFEMRANHHENPTQRVYIDGPRCAKTLLRLIDETQPAGDMQTSQMVRYSIMAVRKFCREHIAEDGQ